MAKFILQRHMDIEQKQLSSAQQQVYVPITNNLNRKEHDAIMQGKNKYEH